MATRFNRKAVPTGWEVVDEWVQCLMARGLRHETIRVKRQHLMRFARCNSGLTPHQLTVELVLNWAAQQDWKPETRHHVYGTFGQFMTWERKRRKDRRPVDFPTVRRPRTLARPVPDDVIDELLHHADARIALAARLAAHAGLRRGEIALIHTNDFIDGETGRSLLVHGKGGVERLVPLSDRLDTAIRTYQQHQNITEGWLFPGSISGHVSSTWLGKLLNGQLPRPWTLHGLRHRFATAVYAATKDIIVVQQLMGHASVATTQRYLAFTPEALRNAVNISDH